MKLFGSTKITLVLAASILTSLLAASPASLSATEGISPDDIMNIKLGGSAQISPDGRYIAYTVYTSRKPDAEPGGSYSELYVASVKTAQTRAYVSGEVNVSSPQWRPDGSAIAFRMARGEKAKVQVWMIPIDGGEAVPITQSKSNVLAFQWHPEGTRIAYLATEPETAREKELQKKGYDFVYFQENLKHRNLYIADVRPGEPAEPRQLSDDITIWSLEFNPDGSTLAVGASPLNLIDQRYMFQKIYLIDVASGSRRRLTDNPGKLGSYAFSPDGSKLAYAAALLREDHAVSQAFVIDVAGGEAKNLTPPKFKGHVNWVGWKDANTVLYGSDEGVWPVLCTVPAKGGERKILLRADDSNASGIIFSEMTYTKDFRHFACTGDAPDRPGDICYWQPGHKLTPITDLNPWVRDRQLGRQEVIRYVASDKVQIEGILIYPVDYRPGRHYPLIVHVHGGPESHYANGWMSRYMDPAQVFAAQGYFFFAPNYRPSTGYGLDFVLPYVGDPAGREFDDIADGIDHLVAEGLVDPERVGLGGGSYGGYAAAWFATYYTQKVRAVCMFVGISDLVSKRGTTDIPYEELYVHSGKKLEDMWDLSRERSPIYYAHQSRTAVLIAGGTDDPRVHPSQSLELYTRLKMNNHPAVRLVQYPGEGHGNRNQTGRIDLLNRHLQWFNWYVRDKKPLDGPMPPLDISDTYGLNFKDDKSTAPPPPPPH